MSEQNSLQIAGEFQIETCKILTTSGMEFTINNVVQNITIFVEEYMKGGELKKIYINVTKL